MKFKFFVPMIFLMSILILNISYAADIEYGSFAEAEAAAHSRAEEYNKKMKEHMKQLNDKWEKQQKELGSDGSTPDVTKITETEDGNKSSGNDAQKKMTGAVDDSVNDLKDQMIKSASANTTGFAGGGAGYQWKVKIVNGKYVLSDSYNEADFITGKKKDEPEGEAEGEDKVADAKAAETKPEEPVKPEPDVVATKPSTGTPSDGSSSSPGSGSSTPGSSGSSSPTGGSSSSPAASPGSGGSSTPSGTGGSPATTKVAKVPAKPGVNVAPTKLPPPAVRLTIEHPTDFTEEVFSTNTNNSTAKNYRLKKFQIPEDTRVKMAMELAPGLDPNKITMILTDEEGQNAPVTATKMRNYRHMFRVPSDKKYKATVYYKDDINSGGQPKKLMEVNIPVTKVDFDARAMASKRRGGGTDGQNLSGDSSTGNYTSGYKRSNFGGSEQVDLSDAYDDPADSASSDNSANSSSEDNYGNQEYSSNNSGGNSSASNNGGANESSGAGGYDNSGSEYADSSSNSSSSSNGNDGANGNYSNGYGSNSRSGSNENSGSAGNSANSGTSGDNGYNSDGSINSNGNSSDSGEGNRSGLENSDNNSSDQYASTSGSNSSGSNGGGSGNGGSGNSQSGYSGTGSSSGSNGNSNSSYDDNSGMNNGNRSGEELIDENSANYSRSSEGSSRATYDSEESKNNTSDRNKNNEGEYVDGEVKELEGEFVVGLSIQAPSLKIYQSFDFIDDTNPTSTIIPAKTEMGIGLSFGAKVDPSTVHVSVNDGANSISGSLDKVGESFAHVLSGKASNVIIKISGVSGKSRFSYSLNVPVS